MLEKNTEERNPARPEKGWEHWRAPCCSSGLVVVCGTGKVWWFFPLIPLEFSPLSLVTSWLQLKAFPEVKWCPSVLFPCFSSLLPLFLWVCHLHNLSVCSPQLCFQFLWFLFAVLNFFCLHCTSASDNAFLPLLISFSILYFPLWWLSPLLQSLFAVLCFRFFDPLPHSFAWFICCPFSFLISLLPYICQY